MDTLALLWRYRVLVLLGLLVLAVVLALRATHYSAREHARAEAAEERARLLQDQALHSTGVVVDVPATVKELERALTVMARKNADLAAQLAAVRKAAPGAKPTSVTHGETPALPANQQAAALPGTPPPGAPACPSPTPECLFDRSSQGKIMLDSATLVTEKGTSLHLVSMSAWRVAPKPETELFSGHLSPEESSALTVVGAAPPTVPARPRLTLSARAEYDPRDLRARPMLAGELSYRALSLWRFDLSAYATVGELDRYEVSTRGGAKLSVGIW